MMASAGLSVPSYAYAANNPLRYVDFDGLAIAVWGAGEDSDSLALLTTLTELRNDPCSREALDDAEQTVFIRSRNWWRSGRKLVGAAYPLSGTPGQGHQIMVDMDPIFIDAPVGPVSNPADELLHELLHALLLTLAPSMIPDETEQHEILEGYKRGKNATIRTRVNSVMDAYRACKKRTACGEAPWK